MNRRTPTVLARPVREASWCAPLRFPKTVAVEVGAADADTDQELGGAHATSSYLFAAGAFAVTVAIILYASRSAAAEF